MQGIFILEILSPKARYPSYTAALVACLPAGRSSVDFRNSPFGLKKPKIFHPAAVRACPPVGRLAKIFERGKLCVLV
jgi:hypothetical protein